MPAPIRRVDEFGFPIPGTFDDAPEPGAARGRKVRSALYRWRWLLLVLLIPLLFYDKLLALAGHWIADRAVQQAGLNLQRHRFPEALAQATRAIYWEPDKFQRAEAYWIRGLVHEQMQHLELSAADYTTVIQSLDDPQHVREWSAGLGLVYRKRALIQERLGQHKAAIDDATTALKFVEWSDRPLALNERAYIRALAGIELQQGLDDIAQALAGANQDEPGFVDTRGYLRFKLGQDYEALADFDSALQHLEQPAPRFGGFGNRRDRWEYEERVRFYRQNLAVIQHHRGEVGADLAQREKLGRWALQSLLADNGASGGSPSFWHAAARKLLGIVPEGQQSYQRLLKREEQAREDLQQAEQLGYNPALGIY